MSKHHLRAVPATAALVAATLIIVPAFATGSLGFTRTEVSTGLLGPVNAKADKTGQWDVTIKSKDDSTLGLDHLSVASGGHSGWHTHAGVTMVTVKVGEVRWYNGADPVCGSTVYRAGDSFIEPANNVHLVRNTTGATVEFTAVQIRPSGAPGRIDAPKPTNCPTI